MPAAVSASRNLTHIPRSGNPAVRHELRGFARSARSAPFCFARAAALKSHFFYELCIVSIQGYKL